MTTRRPWATTLELVDPTNPSPGSPPITLAGTAYLDGTPVPIGRQWKISGGRHDGTRVTFTVPANTVTVRRREDGTWAVSLAGVPVLTPSFAEIDLPARVAESAHYGRTPVEITIHVASVTVTAGHNR